MTDSTVIDDVEINDEPIRRIAAVAASRCPHDGRDWLACVPCLRAHARGMALAAAPPPSRTFAKRTIDDPIAPAELIAAIKVRTGHKLPSDVRARAIAFVRDQIAAGHAQRAIARALGVDGPLICKWLRADEPKTPSPPPAIFADAIATRRGRAPVSADARAAGIAWARAERARGVQLKALGRVARLDPETIAVWLRE